MSEKINEMLGAAWQRRERDLLEANNRYLHEARDARAELASIDDVLVSMRCFVAGPSVLPPIRHDASTAENVVACLELLEKLLLGAAQPATTQMEAKAAATEWLTTMTAKYPLGTDYLIQHDGFAGKVCGYYQRDDGKAGVCLQLNGAKVVHVYGERWLATYRQGGAQ